MYKMNVNNKEISKSTPFDSNQTDSNDSEWGLEIVIKSTPKKRKKNLIDPKDKEIIDKFEKDIEEALEEKAAKSNLSHNTVKSILKHVFTDEHVLALVKQKEGCEDVEGIIPYEPKITRSKAKELYSNAGSVISLPWQTSVATSEVQALLTEDLQEDSSGDEYVPSEDEISLSISNPPTPAAQGASVRQCIDDVQDEIFKTPQQNQKKYRKQCRNSNIALRTRSKFSLSETPLEKIEQDFIPPDIITDMYDIYCNDEEWKEFLKSLTQPLEEVVKCTEDEDHDPEYNFLSDEEIETVDKEELRADKAVKVPRKELNELMAELFEYVDIYSKKNDKETQCQSSLDSTNQIQQQLFDSCREILDSTESPNIQNDENQGMEHFFRNAFTQSQLLLLHQQIRQHVQMLTQNFLLTYCHPFYNDLSATFKEYLLHFKFLSNGNQFSVFNSSNLGNSLELINTWEKLFENNDEAAIETIKQFTEVMEESITLHSKGEYYYLPFPKLIFKTIADNEIFIYPHLLPPIPFKHPDLLKKDISPFSYSEYQLIALGLEQFIPYFMNIKEFMTRKKEINFKKISELVHHFLLPARQTSQIYRQICEKKHEKYLPNPIAYFTMHQKAPLTIHQVNPFINFETVPPRKRPPMLLPKQWRDYIWPEWQKKEDCDKQHFPQPTVMLNEPKKQKAPKTLIKLFPKPSLCPDKPRKNETGPFKKNMNDRKDYILKNKFINCFQSTISYCQYYDLRRIDHSNDNLKSEHIEDSMNKKLLDKEKSIKTDNMPFLDKSDIGEMNILDEDTKKTNRVIEHKSECVTMKTSILDSSESNCHGDNNIAKTVEQFKCNKNELFSSTCENKIQRGREYLSRLAMISPPELPNEKSKKVNFAKNYFNKFKKILHISDFNKAAYLIENSYTKNLNAVDLYKILSPLLNHKYQTLSDELLLFLELEMANAISKLIPFFLTNLLDKFKSNFEEYFKQQPLLLRKIEESFLQQNKTHTSLDKLKKTILPLLRSHSLLCYNILELFLKETTLSSLFNSSWEIDIMKNLGKEEYGKLANSNAESESCDCSCHEAQQKSSHHNCLNCGLRFVNGRIYCHSSKGFKLVNITFPFNPNIDDNRVHNKIDNVKVKHNSSRTLNSKSLSTVESINEIKENSKVNGSPNETKFKCIKKTRRKKQTLKVNIHKKGRMKSRKLKCNSDKICVNKSKNSFEKTIDNLCCNVKSDVECVEPKLCSNKLSQNSHINSSLQKNFGNTNVWTREEDKIILETVQEKCYEGAVHIIQKQLKNRSVEDIRVRFEKLMELMQEMET